MVLISVQRRFVVPDSDCDGRESTTGCRSFARLLASHCYTPISYITRSNGFASTNHAIMKEGQRHYRLCVRYNVEGLQRRGICVFYQKGSFLFVLTIYFSIIYIEIKYLVNNFLLVGIRSLP